MVSEDERQFHFSDVRSILLKLGTVIETASAQSTTEMQPTLDKAGENLKAAAAALQRLVDDDCDFQVWINREGLTCIGGAQPERLLTEEDIASIKGFGLF